MGSPFLRKDQSVYGAAVPSMPMLINYHQFSYDMGCQPLSFFNEVTAIISRNTVVLRYNSYQIYSPEILCIHLCIHSCRGSGDSLDLSVEIWCMQVQSSGSHLGESFVVSLCGLGPMATPSFFQITGLLSRLIWVAPRTPNLRLLGEEAGDTSVFLNNQMHIVGDHCGSYTSCYERTQQFTCRSLRLRMSRLGQCLYIFREGGVGFVHLPLQQWFSIFFQNPLLE